MAHADRELGYEIEITNGDRKIEMLPFVQAIVGNSIKGMLEALKGYDEDEEVVIRIKNK